MKQKILLPLLVPFLAACSQPKDKAVETQCAATLTTCSEQSGKQQASLQFNNADFYNTDGTFNEDKAKDAVIRLMTYHNYPVAEDTKAKIWVSDYGTGKFTELGLACIGYSNNLEDGYMLQDLFLLPNQMLPEHWHIEAGKYPAKMEGWLVRNGKSYIVGVGEDNLASFTDIKIPQCHDDGAVTVKHVIPAEGGVFVPLAEKLSHHWQFAGPEGAVISEVANGHVNENVRHQVKAINDHFLGK